MAAQRVLEVINALRLVWGGAPALDGVVVSKAWEITPEGDLEHVFVASDTRSGTADTDIAIAAIAWPGLSPTSRTEGGTVDCAASVWTDDQTKIDIAVTRAYAIVGACEDVLRLDPELDSTIALQVKITDTRLRVIPDANPPHGEGFWAVVQFLVAFQTSQ